MVVVGSEAGISRAGAGRTGEVSVCRETPRTAEEERATERHSEMGQARGVSAVAPHIQPVDDSLPEDLSDSERQQATNFITEHTQCILKIGL